MNPLRLLPVLVAGAAASPPVAHWNFDGESVEERLAETYGRTELDCLQQSGSSSWQPRSGFGETLANGSGSPFLAVPNSLSPGSGGFTVTLWSYRTTAAGSASGLLDALSSAAASGWQLFYQADNSLRIRVDDTSGHSVLVDTAPSQVLINTWRHIAVTVNRDAGRAKIHVDGVEATPAGGVDISALTAPIVPDQNLWIGTLNGSNPANGRIDDVAIFHRVLSDEEIATLAGGATVLSAFPPAPKPPTVIFSPVNGTVLAPGQTVSLSSSPPDLEIRYTLDGSEPNGTSPLYTHPIIPDGPVTITAAAFIGSEPGPSSKSSYTLHPDTVPAGASLLLISAEGLGYGDPGCYGSPVMRTPHLDALAAGGIRYTQTYNTGPGEAANQYAMLTGRYYDRSGLLPSPPPGGSGLAFREWTLAEAMRKAGRTCGFFGVWRLGDIPGSRPLDQGYQHFTGLPWGPELSPAPPLRTEEETIDPGPDPDSLMSALREAATDFIAQQSNHPFFAHVHLPPMETGSSESANGRRIEAVDALVGELVAQLEACGRREDTMVLLVSTGGANRSNRLNRSSNGLLRDGAGTTWEGGVRIVAIASWPGVIPPAQSLATWSLADLPVCLSSFLKVGWVPDGRHIDGKNRPGVFSGHRLLEEGHEVLPFHLDQGSGSPNVSAIRKGPWKLHRQTRMSDPDNPASNGAVPRLYDLQKDPAEYFDRHMDLGAVRSDLENEALPHLATFTPITNALPVDPVIIGGRLESLNGNPPRPTFAFHRPPDLTDDLYSLETSVDLVHWEEHPLSRLERTVSAVGGTERVEFVAPSEMENASRRFFRLKARVP